MVSKEGTEKHKIVSRSVPTYSLLHLEACELDAGRPGRSVAVSLLNEDCIDLKANSWTRKIVLSMRLDSAKLHWRASLADNKSSYSLGREPGVQATPQLLFVF